MMPKVRAHARAKAPSVRAVGDARRHQAAHDRRSAHRPRFTDGWRKRIATPTAAMTPMDVARIDVWLVDTEALLKAHSCLALLTEDDWSAITRLNDPSARYSAMAARIVVRLALSRAVDRRVAPVEWRFSATAHGKPIVSAPVPDINFTVSHVDELTAVAVARGLRLGIDIECVDREISEKVIDSYSHPTEQKSLRGLAPAQRFREFIRFWTMKEAYSKLLGIGHSIDFETIKCPVGAGAIVGPGATAQTEKFFVSVGHKLFHAAVAIEPPEDTGPAAELQIINMAAPDEGVASISPVSGG